MVIFESLSKRVQGIVSKYMLSKKALDKAEIMNKKCREVLIKELCENHGLLSEKIVFTKEKLELSIAGNSRTDTAWAKVWQEFDKTFYPLIENDDFLSGEYLKLRRTAELNNKKSPYLRWEIRPKNGQTEE